MDTHNSRNGGTNDGLLALLFRLREKLGKDPKLADHIQTTIDSLTTDKKQEKSASDKPH